MVSEQDNRKYRIRVANDGVSLPGIFNIWEYSAFDECVRSPVYDTWQAVMDECVRLGIGRKTGESGTYELNPGVEIRAEPPDDQ